MNVNNIEERKSLALPLPWKKNWKKDVHPKSNGKLADDARYTGRIPFIKKFSTPVRGHIVAVLGEGVGTFLFLFFAFAATLNANTTNDQIVSKNLYISLGFGFSLTVNAWTFFRVSGGLFNPAVTWGMCLVGGITWFRGLLLFVTQLVAALVAAGMARALFPADLNVQTTLDAGTTIVQGFFIEMFLTLQLVLTIFLLAAEKHRATFIAPVGIGLALFLAELAGVRYTGGSLNPARSFAPAVVNMNFRSYHWIYWIGPLLGATIAAVIYKLIKMLEYETANPDLDDSVEQKFIIADPSTLEALAQRSESQGNDNRMSLAATEMNGANSGSTVPLGRRAQEPQDIYQAGPGLENGGNAPGVSSSHRD